MPHIRTSLLLDAPIADVWAVLSDVPGWAAWTSVMTRVRGEPRVGGRISFRIAIPGLPTLPIDATYTVASPERGLAWRGGIPGVLVGVHAMALERAGDGTRVLHHERFTGLLAVPVIGPVGKRIQRAYQTFNDDLRRRVESPRKG